MTIALAFVFIAVAALLLIIYLSAARKARNGDLDGLAAQLRPIDVNAFRNLIDESEESFLRERLPAREFRSIHRERMLAAAEYVRGAARNAGILVRLAEAAAGDEDPSVATAAQNLLESALQLRLYAFQTLPRLYLSILLPHIGHTPRSLAETYESMTHRMVTLRCLKFARPQII